MSFYVVDTNVPIVANGHSEQADPDCVVACIGALTTIKEQGVVILDDLGLILQEYMHNLHLSGQPGVGDAFMKWVFDRQADCAWCKQVHITPSGNDLDDFVEFPDDDRLVHFDRSDRKFVAVALSSGVEAQILNAVDTDWSEYFVPLRETGLDITFLCPQHVYSGR